MNLHHKCLAELVLVEHKLGKRRREATKRFVASLGGLKNNWRNTQEVPTKTKIPHSRSARIRKLAALASGGVCGAISTVNVVKRIAQKLLVFFAASDAAMFVRGKSSDSACQAR